MDCPQLLSLAMEISHLLSMRLATVRPKHRNLRPIPLSMGKPNNPPALAEAMARPLPGSQVIHSLSHNHLAMLNQIQVHSMPLPHYPVIRAQQLKLDMHQRLMVHPLPNQVMAKGHHLTTVIALVTHNLDHILRMVVQHRPLNLFRQVELQNHHHNHKNEW